ncbi:DNA-binding response regulator [Gordonia alkaliphila]|uniref:helix-turn-helix transcriptional regulator n=1 Tax=Gordonia alkaliphila TaxID=1053547 RepID=UPI001FF1DB8E|nr:DNA-binding response regulator [Gordonia alkaliphila]MCK0438976.1 DNA-binding response regulator [Gordonia alkaliphila]
MADVDPFDATAEMPAVIVAGSQDPALRKTLPWAIASRVVVIGGDEADGVKGGLRHLADSAGVAERLRVLLAAEVGMPQGLVRISRREQEVLTTYVLGATVEETVEEHFVAASTVRTHYRRATQRYSDAGRPVLNKTQLLLQMIADGWIDVHGGSKPSNTMGLRRSRDPESCECA